MGIHVSTGARDSHIAVKRPCVMVCTSQNMVNMALNMVNMALNMVNMALLGTVRHCYALLGMSGMVI